LQPQLIGFMALLAVRGLFPALLKALRNVLPALSRCSAAGANPDPDTDASHGDCLIRRQFDRCAGSPSRSSIRSTFIEVVLAPLLGTAPRAASYAAALAITAVRWFLAF